VERLNGIGVSAGTVVGPALVAIQRTQVIRFPIAPDRVARELSALERARIRSREQIEQIRRRVHDLRGADLAAIFDAQLLMLDDPMLVGRAATIVMEERVNAEWAVQRALDEIAAVLNPAGIDFVDGCIIGSAAKMGKGTIVYVSGQQASRLQSLESFNIPIKVLGPNTNQASAFKVVYAGLTKGLQGLFCELFMGARRFGLLKELTAQYEDSFPGLIDKVSSSIVGLRIHARRRAEEMDELKRTFNHHGMESFMAPAVQKVLESIAALEIEKASESGARQGDLQETLELFYQKGLLQVNAAGRNS